MFTPIEVAQLLDTEGTIMSAAVNGGHPIPRVILGMTTEVYPRLMHQQFGGRLSFYKHEKVEHKDVWTWYIDSKKCEEVLVYALPELRLKRQQAAACLLMLPAISGKGKKPTDAQALLRWKLHEIIKGLNRKGKVRSVELERLVEVENEEA